MTDGDWMAQMRMEIGAAWAIAKKDMYIYYLRPNIIVSGLLFPLFMFLAFSIGNTSGASILMAGLIAITILFSASSIEPVSVPIERRTKTYDRLLSAPISLNALVVGESLSGFIYSLAIAMAPFIAGLLIFGTPINNVVSLVVGLMLTAFCIASMGTLFASYPTESPGDIMSMLNVVRLPLLFISGIFIPLSAIPPAAQFVTYFSPLTYGYDLILGGYTGSSHYNPFFDIIMLFVFIVFFQLLADRLYKRYST